MQHIKNTSIPFPPNKSSTLPVLLTKGLNHLICLGFISIYNIPRFFFTSAYGALSPYQFLFLVKKCSYVAKCERNTHAFVRKLCWTSLRSKTFIRIDAVEP